jgi:hypothetical protein
VDFHHIEDHGVTLLIVASQQSTKCQWQIEKPLKFTGRFGYKK